jgi:hypothetical protein
MKLATTLLPHYKNQNGIKNNLFHLYKAVATFQATELSLGVFCRKQIYFNVNKGNAQSDT